MLENLVNNTQSEEEFIDEFSKSVESVETGKDTDNDDGFGPMEPPEPEPLDPKIIRESNTTSVDFIVKIFDKLISQFIAKYAHSPNPENFQALDKELREIAVILNRMTPAQKAIMPNWMQLLLAGFSIYGIKFYYANAMRNEYESNHFRNE